MVRCAGLWVALEYPRTHHGMTRCAELFARPRSSLLQFRLISLISLAPGSRLGSTIVWSALLSLHCTLSFLGSDPDGFHLTGWPPCCDTPRPCRRPFTPSCIVDPCCCPWATRQACSECSQDPYTSVYELQRFFYIPSRLQRFDVVVQLCPFSGHQIRHFPCSPEAPIRWRSAKEAVVDLEYREKQLYPQADDHRELMKYVNFLGMRSKTASKCQSWNHTSSTLH